MLNQKDFKIEDYERIGEQFNEIIDKLATLECDVSNTFGKTKMRKMDTKLRKASNIISECRFEIESMVYPKFKEFITSFRKYRENKYV